MFPFFGDETAIAITDSFAIHPNLAASSASSSFTWMKHNTKRLTSSFNLLWTTSIIHSCSSGSGSLCIAKGYKLEMRSIKVSLTTAILSSVASGALGWSVNTNIQETSCTRRKWLSESVAKVSVAAGIFVPARAFADDGYENPNIPASPEEKCKCWWYYDILFI